MTWTLEPICETNSVPTDLAMCQSIQRLFNYPEDVTKRQEENKNTFECVKVCNDNLRGASVNAWADKSYSECKK
jgi:hypothetical protein